MKKFQLKVDAKDTGKRIDAYLSQSEEIPSRSYAQKLLKSGAVLVNGKEVNKSHRLSKNDLLEFKIGEPEQIEVEPQDLPINIVYEDDDLAVVEKPAGMVTHPSYGHWKGTLVNALLYKLKGLSSIGGVMRPGIIHRLDKDTSGLLIVAKNDKSHLTLSREIKDRKVKRRYIALVHGHMQESKGKIDMPIGRSYKDRKKMAVIQDGRPSVTSYSVSESCKKYDLLEISLFTGRTHQIRVHMASIGHPVVGDDVYGPKNEREKVGLSRYFLHAFELTFSHPSTGKEMYFLSPLPEELHEFMDKMGSIN